MYPDTTRFVYAGIEATEKTLASVMRFMHTTNEPAHTLKNGLIIPQENTGTRTRDNGQARGRRSSSIRIQSYIRLQEIGLWLKSAIGVQVTTPFPDGTTQTVALTGVPTGGTFKLDYGGQLTSALTATTVTGAAVQTALEALSNLVPGDVSVAGSAGGPWTVTFPALDPGAPNGLDGPYILKKAAVALTGGTNPNVTVTPGTITSAYLHAFIGGVIRGVPLSLQFFNGLYWRQMLGCRVNTMNIQGMGNGLALVDMEIIGQASTKISPPTVVLEDTEYDPIDAPMQFVQILGLIDADVDRFNINVNNNLTQRSTMDRSTSTGRTRFGDFAVDFDGMADYPQYAGSLYESFEANTRIGSLDLFMVDDQFEVGTGTPINPYLHGRLPSPVLADMTEGSDGGELVQMIKGKGQYSVTETATVIFYLANDKPSTYYDPS